MTMIVVLIIAIIAVVARFFIRRMQRKMNNDKVSISQQPSWVRWLFLAGAIIVYITIFNLFDPQIITAHIKGRITQADIEANAQADFTGRLAGDDIERYRADKAPTKYFTIDAEKIVATGFYLIKDINDLSEINTSKTLEGKHSIAIERSNKAFEVMRNPGEYKSFYNQLYAVQLADSSYILVWSYDQYMKQPANGKATTLPIGTLRSTNSKIRNVISKIDTLGNIESQSFVVAFDNKNYVRNENIDLACKGVAALISVLLLYLLLNKVLKRKI